MSVWGNSLASAPLREQRPSFVKTSSISTIPASTRRPITENDR